MAGYGTSMVLRYIVGQQKNPFPYPMKDMALYVLATVVLYGAMLLVPDTWPNFWRIAANTLFILLFMALIVKRDYPLSNLPVIGKKFKKQ